MNVIFLFLGNFPITICIGKVFKNDITSCACRAGGFRCLDRDVTGRQCFFAQQAGRAES